MTGNGRVLLKWWPVLLVAGMALIGWGFNTAVDAEQGRRLDAQDGRNAKIDRTLREQAEINGQLKEQGRATKDALDNLTGRIDRVLESYRPREYR